MKVHNWLAQARLEDALVVLHSIDCVKSCVDGGELMRIIAELELLKNKVKNCIYADYAGWEDMG